MKMEHEIVNEDSCFNKARIDETVFILLGRDPSAAAAIREWAKDRIMRGKNKADDPQIVSALADANQMALEAAAYQMAKQG